MLKFTTVDDGSFSPTHHRDTIDTYLTNSLQVSAGSKAGAKMAIKRRTKRTHPRAPEQPHLPPISHGSSPQGVQISTSQVSMTDRRDYTQNQTVKRKEIKTPYVAHIGINRVTDVATPYVLHTQLNNVDPSSPRIIRENSKLSGNVIELRHETELLRPEPTFSSLQKFPTNSSPLLEKRPKGRHGRTKNFSTDENGVDRNAPDLQIQSNQMGLYQRAERRQKERSKGNGGESFSIRKKIEQFRRWHEEQYREKIKKLKQEVDHQYDVEQHKFARQIVGLRETPTSKNDHSVTIEHEIVERVCSPKSQEKMEEDKETTNALSATTDTKPRTESARTWKTWRHVNDSYAYNDVKKYIKDNELMDPEKEMWIKKWIIEVNKAMREAKFHEDLL